jgi:hypothetical protein
VELSWGEGPGGLNAWKYGVAVLEGFFLIPLRFSWRFHDGLC